MGVTAVSYNVLASSPCGKCEIWLHDPFSYNIRSGNAFYGVEKEIVSWHRVYICFFSGHCIPIIFHQPAEADLPVFRRQSSVTALEGSQSNPSLFPVACLLIWFLQRDREVEGSNSESHSCQEALILLLPLWSSSSTPKYFLWGPWVPSISFLLSTSTPASWPSERMTLCTEKIELTGRELSSDFHKRGTFHPFVRTFLWLASVDSTSLESCSVLGIISQVFPLPLPDPASRTSLWVFTISPRPLPWCSFFHWYLPSWAFPTLTSQIPSLEPIERPSNSLEPGIHTSW